MEEVGGSETGVAVGRQAMGPEGESVAFAQIPRGILVLSFALEDVIALWELKDWLCPISYISSLY